MKSVFKLTLKLFLMLVFILISISNAIFSCVEASEGNIPVFVSILPQKFFVDQIGKERVDVQVMVQPGASPHTYEPKPQQMIALSKTKIYFASGLPFEKIWLGKVSASNKNMKIVNTDDGIKKIQMVSHYHHEKHIEQSHSDANLGEADPHIWLSPKLVAIQAQHILNGLKAVDPDSSSFYDTNYQIFISEIEKLDAELNSIFADKKGLQFMVFHPSWGYFAQDYNLEELPIEIEGKNPKPAQLQELISHARKNKISIIFVQPQFSVKSAQQIAKEIDGEVIFADPLGYDWFKNLRDVADKFQSALK
ncbi:MAG: zinc ABC transporter substrate-binding protein [Desulfamplus sp.]|nr:zinc ABC transporter substrate-binding protein [Desulfamplus sp.]